MKSTRKPLINLVSNCVNLWVPIVNCYNSNYTLLLAMYVEPIAQRSILLNDGEAPLE